MTSMTQSVVFPKRYWSLTSAKHWFANHGYILLKNKKIDNSETQYRFRVQDSNKFKRFRTEKIIHDDKPILLIIGFYR